MRALVLSAVLSAMLSTTLTSGRAAAGADDWLMKINRAAASLSFSGVFVYAHDGEVEAMQVARRVRDDLMQERLYALNGEAREIVRDADRIWCYIPNQKLGVHDHRRAFASGFPRIEADDLDRLRRNYRFTEGGVERIADRMARRIDVVPNDGYRYGYRLWADLETGLLLRSDLVGDDARVVEQYLFVTIDLDGEVSDRALEAVTRKDKLVWYGGDSPAPNDADDASADASKWRVERVPPGYRLSRYIRRMSPLEGAEVEHLIFSDGLSTVSVFIKAARAEQNDLQGLSRMGAVHV
ncbi:MAG: MucB/RseB C-terminal domain-containing protein, partial [bacterium]